MAEFQVRKMVNSRSVVAPRQELEESQVVKMCTKRQIVDDVIDEKSDEPKRRKISSDTAADVTCSKVVELEDHDGNNEPQTDSASVLGRSDATKKAPWKNKYQLLEQLNDEDEEVEEGEISEGETKYAAERRGHKACSCSHLQELEAMKLELAKVRKESKFRADEIKSLQKLVSALSRKEGLA